MREIDNLVHELKDIYEEFEECRRSRDRLAKKARKLANKVRKHYPDMLIQDDSSGLHSKIESLACDLHLPHEESIHCNSEDSMLRSASSFASLFSFLKRLATDVPWLDPLGG